jgi:hypothetical protein
MRDQISDLMGRARYSPYNMANIHVLSSLHFVKNRWPLRRPGKHAGREPVFTTYPCFAACGTRPPCGDCRRWPRCTIGAGDSWLCRKNRARTSSYWHSAADTPGWIRIEILRSGGPEEQGRAVSPLGSRQNDEDENFPCPPCAGSRGKHRPPAVHSDARGSPRRPCRPRQALPGQPSILCEAGSRFLAPLHFGRARLEDEPRSPDQRRTASPPHRSKSKGAPSACPDPKPACWQNRSPDDRR